MMCVTPFAWIYDIQSLEKLFRWKSFGDGARNLVRKSDNFFPWSKVTRFSFDDMPSPRQFKLKSIQYINDFTSGSDAVISSCTSSRVFSLRVLFDIKSVYLEDTSIPLVEREEDLTEVSETSRGAEGSRGFNASSRSTISCKLEPQI